MESTPPSPLSSPKGLFRLNTTVAPPSPSSIHSLDYKMPSTTFATSQQQRTPPPSTYRKPRSPPLSPTKRKPPPIPAPSSPTTTVPGGITIPSPAATTTTIGTTSPTISVGQLQIPRRQYSDERFDTVSSSSGSLASTGSPHTSYSGRTFGYSAGYEQQLQQQQHQQQRSPSPPLILSSLGLSHTNISPRLEAVEEKTSSPALLPTLISSFGGRRGQAKDLKRISTNSLSSSPVASPRRTATPSLDSPIRDPYRSRGVTGLSAKGVKNDMNKGTRREGLALNCRKVVHFLTVFVQLDLGGAHCSCPPYLTRLRPCCLIISPSP
ncbi:MAG: hypothetical protein JOS17DRAFT_167773 [Linnemannia elongata]|nr:MAG: hypothetical protein JOS17DRAFT_167773 [Linnemannia elongata]